MNNYAIGSSILSFFGAAIAFIIAALILRGIFAIKRIVDLLTTIAQELRAANAVNGIDAKLKAVGIDEKLGKFLNSLEPREFFVKKQAPAEEAASQVPPQ
jgi:hypothetical protein